MNEERKHDIHQSGLKRVTVIYPQNNDVIDTNITVHEINAETHNHFSEEEIEITSLTESDKKIYWVDICGLKNKDKIVTLCHQLDIHPLAIEDILNPHQRSKIDVFDNCFLIFLKFMPYQESGKHITEQISLIIKGNIILTFRETENISFERIHERLQNQSSDIRNRDSSYFLYVLLDTVVDNYFLINKRIHQRLEYFEDLIATRPDKIALGNLYLLKRKIIFLHKIIQPLRDITGILLHEKLPCVNNDHHYYFRDLFDHATRLIEETDVFRQMTDSLLDIYLSHVNNRMNETMRILTVYASIFIPLTAISSIYGMNFVYMPELKFHYGYYVVLGVMFLLAVGTLFFFKRKKWL